METAPLKSVCEIIMGQAPSGDTYNDEENGWPLIAGASDFGELTPSPSQFTTSPSKLSKVDDIIICIRATIGDLNWSDKEYCLGRGVASLRVDERKADKNYIWRVLGYNAKNLSALGRGATFKQISKPDIADFEIPLPPLEEQKRIAAILDQADDIRRKRQHAIDRLNQLGQAIFHEMFGGARSLDTASLKTLGKVSTGSTPPTSDANSFGGPVPFVTPGDLGVSGMIKRSLSETGALKSRIVSAGSTFVCCIGATIGKMDQAHQRSAFNQQINAIEWGSRIDPMFGFFAVRQIRGEIIRKGKGASTTLPILKKSEFEKLHIIVPKIEDQKLFSSKIDELTFLLQQLSSHYGSLTNLFASLQHRAFTGQL